MSNAWCLIESDPAVFNDLLATLGIKGVQVEEITSLTDGDLERLYPIYGFIFLYMVDQDDTDFEDNASSYLGVEESSDRSVYFVSQSVQNACATVAILNLMLNIDRSKHSDVELGGVLSNFLEFTECMDFDTRGMALANSEQMVQSHNKYREQSLFDNAEIGTNVPNVKKQNSFHYTVFMPIKQHLYELNGIKKGPKDCGEIEDGQNTAWIQKAVEIMKSRMSAAESSQKKDTNNNNGQFNIMVVCGDLVKKYKQQHAEIVAATGNGIPTEEQMIKMSQLESLVRNETDKIEKYKEENIFRLHNWTPFVLDLLKLMAAKKILKPAVEDALGKNPPQ